VNSTLVHTYNETLPEFTPPQSSILDGTKEREFRLAGLFPGSTYQVCIQENTATGFGEAACANFSTKPSVDFKKGPLTAYYLLVIKKIHEVVAPIRLANFSAAEDLQLGYYVAARFTPRDVGDGIRFIVGAGGTVDRFVNPPLEAGVPYSFGWAAETSFSDETLYGYRLSAPIIGKYTFALPLLRGNVGKSVLNSDSQQVSVPVNGSDNSYWPFIAGSLLCLCLLALTAAGITCYCRRKRSSHPWPSDNASAIVLEERFAEHPKCIQESQPASDRKEQRAELNEYISMESKSATAAAPVSAPTGPSNPVPIKNFREYVAQALVEGTLALEYKKLTNGVLHPAAASAKSDNRSKTNHGNIQP
ncbi:hypothetical protein MTO96_042047, partial [Rhipicephalus appendiculatus]